MSLSKKLLHKKIKTLFSESSVTFLVPFIMVASLCLYGYTHNEDLVDNEILEVENSKIVEYIIPREVTTERTNKVTSTLTTATTYGSVTDTTASSTTPLVYPYAVTIPVLVYHKISSLDFLLTKNKKNNSKKYSVQSDVFKEQMQFIVNEGYTPLTMKEAIEGKVHNTLPRKPIVITFDDGWRSQYQNAVPVLTQLHIPATFYIYTGVIGAGAYMTWENLHDLVRLNMEIGDHTKSHPRLTKINANRLDEELLQSKIVLERNLHVTVSDIAYPYGDYNALIIDAVKKYGYVSARTSRHALTDDLSDLYQIKVIYVPSDLKTFKELLLH